MKKKKRNDMKKKKTVQGDGIGYCPVSSLGHDTMGLYRDTAGMGAQPGATIRLAVGHDTAGYGPRDTHNSATIRPRGFTIWQACAQSKRRARGPGHWE